MLIRFQIYQSYIIPICTVTGEVGIVMSTDWTEAKDPGNPEDCAMAERFLQCQMGWFANPFFGDGDYPQLMKEYMELNKIQNSLESSLLPAFTKEEIETNRGETIPKT